MEHNQASGVWAANNPGIAQRNNFFVNTKSLPNVKIDAGLFQVNPDTGFFEPTGSLEGDYKVPNARLLGTAGKGESTGRRVYDPQTGTFK